MKLLYGSELADYIKERQAKQVRGLRQSWGVIPKLVILKTHSQRASDKYIEKKIEYAQDILIETEVVECLIDDIKDTIKRFNNNKSVHGIIGQLTISDQRKTNEIVNTISPKKDVDGLGLDSKFTPATALAIDWLLAGHNIELRGKDIAIIGQGRLVGRPLYKLWRDQDLRVRIFRRSDSKGLSEIAQPDIIVGAAGSPGIITETMVKPGCVVIDVGTTELGGKLVGDVSERVRQLENISITPTIGGVGPLTVAALMDNVITSAKSVALEAGQKDLN